MTTCELKLVTLVPLLNPKAAIPNNIFFGRRVGPARILIGRKTVRLGPRLIPLRLATAMVEHPVIAAPVLKPTWARHAEAMPVMARPTTREGAR